MKVAIWRKRCWAVVMTLVLMLTVGNVSPSQASPASQSETVISLSVPFFFEDILTDDVIREFEAQHPGVRLDVRNQDFVIGVAGSDVEATLDAAKQLAEEADVVLVDNLTLGVAATRAGYFLDLTPLVNSDLTLNPAEFYPAAWQSFQWDDGIWALPIGGNLVLVNYDQAAFDSVGLLYPDENWTLADYAEAARTLTNRRSDGSVVPGMALGAEQLPNFFAALTGARYFDSSTSPAQPAIATQERAALLQDWLTLEKEGILQVGFSEQYGEIPLRIEAGAGFFMNPEAEIGQSLLPGGTSILESQGFAISAGTNEPALAYELVRFLTSRVEFVNNPLSQVLTVSVPALRDVQVTTDEFFPQASPLVQTLLDNGLEGVIPAADLRFGDYVLTALNAVRENEIDPLLALQNAELQAIADLQLASDQRGQQTINIVPPREVPTGSGSDILNVGINYLSGGIVLMTNNELPNQQLWDQLMQDFVSTNAEIGRVNLESSDDDFETMTQNYECFITTSNLIPSNDVGMLLNLDPFIDADFDFDRNDVLGGILNQVSVNDRVWGLPIGVQPATMQYSPDFFEAAGLSLPTNGWTIDAFEDALRMLGTQNGAPYVPNDPSGSYAYRLIAAYGGLPIDARTTPATINFTDPNTVNAIRQVLDLAREGYIDYEPLATNQFIFSFGGDPAALSSLPSFLLPLGLEGAPDQPVSLPVTYPTGRDFSVISLDIVVGYISANAQNPQACYRWLREVSQYPQLFSSLPAYQSQMDDASIIEQLPPGSEDIIAQLRTILNDPSVVYLPSEIVSDFTLDYWLRRAFDRYVLDAADLETELADAEIITNAYQQCVATIAADSDNYFQEAFQCALAADPTFR